jgi:hypothetical protein
VRDNPKGATYRVGSTLGFHFLGKRIVSDGNCPTLVTPRRHVAWLPQ